MTGSWEGLLTGIWVDPSLQAGYVYSTLSGTVSGDSLKASGDAQRIPGLGTIDDLEDLVEMTPSITGLPLPEIASLPVGGGSIVGGSEMMAGFSANGGSRYLSVWTLQTAGGTVDPAFQGTSNTVLYADPDGSYYSLGYLTIADNGAGVVKISPFADTPITYIDDEFIGSIKTWYRGVHDGYGGGYTSVGAGSFTLDRVAYSGDWGAVSLYHADSSGTFDDVGSDYGIFAGLASPWDSSSTDFLVLGDFSVDPGYGGTPLLWNTELYGQGRDSGGSPEGDIEGYTGGHWRTDTEMAGSAAAIYLAPDGRAGQLTGNLSGNWFSGVDMFAASGRLSRTYQETLPGYGGYWIGTSPITARLSGDFNGEGSIDGYNWNSQFRYLTNGSDQRPWGVYNLRLGSGNGYYRSADTFTEWNATVGGTISMADIAYYLGTVGGSWDAAGEINGQLNATWQSATHRGKMKGPFYGHNVPASPWIGQSIGTFDSDPLEWGSQFNSNLLAHSSGSLAPTVILNATIGSFSAPWLATSSDFYALGSLAATPSGNQLLSLAIQTSATGELQALMGGQWNSAGTIANTTAVALYTAADGQAGLVQGTAAGDWYPDLNMFELDGSWSSLATASGAPGDISIRNNGPFGAGQFYGGFAPGYSVLAGTGPSQSYNLQNDTAMETLPLGIFSQQLVGGIYMRPTDEINWTAVFGGANAFGGYGGDSGYYLAQADGTWNDDGQIVGSLEQGTYLTKTHTGSVFGGLTGLADPGYGGSWAGQVVGGWQGDLLTFGGDLDSGWAEFNDYGSLSGAASLNGLFGLSARNASSYNALTIGTFDDTAQTGTPYLFNSEVDGNEVGASYGQFFGYTGGLWRNTSDADSLEGGINLYTALVAFRDDGTLTLFTGDMAGTAYDTNADNDGLFLVDGVLSAQQFTMPHNDPHMMSDSSESMDGGLVGRFADSETDNIFGFNYGNTRFIYNNFNGTVSANFGVFRMEYENGMYLDMPLTGPDAPDQVSWSAVTGGPGGFGADWENEGYWKASINSTWYNADGTIDGDITGTYLTPTHIGSLSGKFSGLYGIEGGFYGGGDFHGFGTWAGIGIGSYQTTQQLDFGAEVEGGGGHRQPDLQRQRQPGRRLRRLYTRHLRLHPGGRQLQPAGHGDLPGLRLQPDTLGLRRPLPVQLQVRRRRGPRQ